MPTNLIMRDKPLRPRRPPTSPALLIACLSLAAVVLFAATVRFAPPTHVRWPAQMGHLEPVAPT